MERDEKLFAGFLSRNPAAEASFVAELQKYLQAEVRTYAPHLWWQLADLEQSALLKLCEMREKPEEVEKIRPPFPALARFLMAGPASKEKRVKHWPRLKKSQEPKQAPNQEMAIELSELTEIAQSLPRGMARTMLAQEAHLAGDGPPLEEALGIGFQERAPSARSRSRRGSGDCARRGRGCGEARTRMSEVKKNHRRQDLLLYEQNLLDARTSAGSWEEHSARLRGMPGDLGDGEALSADVARGAQARRSSRPRSCWRGSRRRCGRRRRHRRRSSRACGWRWSGLRLAGGERGVHRRSDAAEALRACNGGPLGDGRGRRRGRGAAAAAERGRRD